MDMDDMVGIDLTMLAKELYPGTEHRLDEFIIVWLYPDENLKQHYSDQLHMYANTILTFDDVDECISYIINIEPSCKVLFIAADLAGRTIIPLICELPQIIFIYFFCINGIETTCTKMIGRIFPDWNTLFKKVQIDIEECVNVTLPMSILEPATENSTQSLTTNGDMLEFFWFQILIEILIRFDNRDFWKDTMISMCELYYKDNQSELQKINDFKLSYTSDKAIWWYTRDSFLFRLVNKALRSTNIHYIVPYHFFIADVHKQLCYLHERNHMENSILTVYRGQIMNTHELDNIKRNVGGLISMNMFLSSTINRQVALMFAGDSTNNLGESVLFEITINKSVKTKYAFMNISNYSHFHDEQEYLFTIGSVFRIESVRKEEHIWIIMLTIAVNDTLELEELEKYLKNKMGETTNYLTLAKTFMDMGEFDKAEKIYKVFEKMCIAGRENTYRSLARLYVAQGKFSLALDYGNKAMEGSDISNRNLITTHTLLGQLHLKNGSFHDALDNLLKAERLLLEKPITDEYCNHLELVYQTFGGVYQKLADIPRALINYEKCMKIQERYLPQFHFNKAATFKYMGICYDDKKDHATALIYHKKTLEIQLKCLKPNHPHLASTYNDIGLCYFYKNDPVSALYHYEKADEIFSGHVSCDPTMIATLYGNMGLFCIKILHNYPLALQYLDKSLNLMWKSSSHNSYRFIRLYGNIGGAYYESGKQILLNSRKTIILTSSPKFIDDALIEMRQASIYFEKALRIATKTLPTNHPDIINCQSRVDIMQTYIENLEEIKRHKRA